MVRALGLTALALFATAALPGISRAQAACTITWDGQLGTSWFAMAPNGPGPEDDVYNWSPERYPDANDDVCFPSGAVASTTLETQNTPTVRSFTISAGATLNITQVQMIVGADSLNAGTLNMSGPVPVTVSDGAPADGELLTNTGTINFTAGGASGLRAIAGDLLNQGTINVDHPEASLQQPGAGGPPETVLTNQGTIDISAGNSLRSIFSTFVHGQGSVITGGGTMNMDQERFEVSGNAQVVAPTDVNMTNSTLEGTAGAATGNIDIHGAVAGGGPSTLEGTLPAGVTADVDGVTLNSAAVTTTVNAGRINLNGNGAHLQVLPNDAGANSTSKLTNTGTIEFTSGGAAGLRLITGRLDNQGTVQVNHPEASFQAPGGTSTPPRLTNTGTISVSAGNTLRAIQDPVIVNGTNGVFSGAGTVNHSTGRLEVTGDGQVATPLDYNLVGGADLVFSAASAAGGNIDINGSGFDPCDLTGNVPAGVSLDIQNAWLRSATSYTNAGTLTLHRAAGDSFEASLRTEDGSAGTVETLTNTGTIAATGTLGSPRIAGDLLNQGTISIANPSVRFESETEARTPTLTNASTGTVTVNNGGLLALVPGEAEEFVNAGAVQLNGTLAPISYRQTGGTTTLAATNAIGLSPGGEVALQGGTLRGAGSITGGDLNNTGGTVAPGTSPGTLTLTEDFTQGPGGTLAIEVSGADPGTGYDQLVVGGTASLGGTLEVETSGFVPATGQQFEIIDAPAPPDPAVSGTFTPVEQSGGSSYTVAYNPGDVTLTALAQQPPPDTDGDGVPDASDECPAAAGPASNDGCPVVIPPDEACDEAKDKLARAKAKLKKLKKKDAPKKKIKKAKKKVKKAKAAVAEACA